MQKTYTIDQTAAVVGCNARTVRRHLAAGRLPGAYQQHTAHGSAWRIPAAGVDWLRSHLALEVMPGAVEVELELPAPAPAAAIVPAAPAEPGGLGPLGGAFDTLGRALERAQDDALWWRCEALDARQQLEAARIEAEATRGELARLRQQVAELDAQLDGHRRPTVRLDQLRRLREA